MKRRLAHLFHFQLLPNLLRRWPRPIWRLPAALMAIGRALLDIKTRQLAGNALLALGQRNTALARWRFCWQIAYHVETNLLLGLQADRLDLPWAREYVSYDSVPSTGGAILISLHHANSRTGFLRLGEVTTPLGVVVAATLAREGASATGPREPAGVSVHYSRSSQDLRVRIFGDNIFSATHDVRRALHFLRQDGYLVIHPDARFVGEARWPVLYRSAGEICIGDRVS